MPTRGGFEKTTEPNNFGMTGRQNQQMADWQQKKYRKFNGSNNGGFQQINDG
jgi:hypothetical protein